jgi:hypothetical protein
VIVSEHNSLGDGRYYDSESSSSFAFYHATQKAFDVQSYSLESKQSELLWVYAVTNTVDLGSNG